MLRPVHSPAIAPRPGAAVDNVMRRSLKISNPYDPAEVAKGLLARYRDEAERIKREQQGLPFSVMQAQAPVAPPTNGTGRPEMRRATDAIEAALKELTTSPDLADIQPELSGWASMIRRACADGFASASYAIDAGERDRAFGARRSLGEFGRLARYAAAVNSCATEIYCRLAQACDLAANVMLVAIGDALGDAGITRSGGILQVTAATLEIPPQRRGRGVAQSAGAERHRRPGHLAARATGGAGHLRRARGSGLARPARPAR